MEEITEKGLSRSLQAKFDMSSPVSVADAVAQSQTLSAFGVDRVLPRQVATGTYRGQQSVGSNNVIIDSEGNRIIIADDVNNRVILGKVT